MTPRSNGTVEKDVTCQEEWNIPNFLQLHQDLEKFKLDKCVLQTKQGQRSVWIIGIKKHLLGGILPCVYVTYTLSKTNGYENPELEGKFETGVKNAEGNTIWTMEVCASDLITLERDCTIKVNETVEVWVANTIARGTHTISNALHSNGSLTLNVKITVKNPRTYSSAAVPNQKLLQLRKYSQNMLLAKLTMLLGDEKSSDVKIITSDNVTLHAHQLILKLQNPVIASLLTADFARSAKGAVKVNDICGKTMRIILHYLYTGELLPTWCDPDIITEFTYAAGKFQLREVLKVLDSLIGSENNEDYNCHYVSLLSLANKLSLTNAEARLQKLISEAIAKAKSTEEIFTIIRAKGNGEKTCFCSRDARKRLLDDE